jgi:paraquat-inducible protein A
MSTNEPLSTLPTSPVRPTSESASTQESTPANESLPVKKPAQIGESLSSKESTLNSETIPIKTIWYYTAIIVSLMFFVFGIFYPCMTVEPPKNDPVINIVGVVNKGLKAERAELAIAAGVYKLFEHGEWFVASLIGLFSIVFPLVKLCMLLWLIYEKDHTRKPKVMKIIEKISKYSMLDVLVLAMLLLTIKKLPGNFEVRMSYGIYAFAISLLITFAITFLLYRDISKLTHSAQEPSALPASGNA